MENCKEDQSWRLPCASFLTLGLSVTCFYVRLRFRPRALQFPHRRQYFADDWLLFLPLLLCLSMAISTILAAKEGLGRHYQCIPPSGTAYFLKSLVAWEYLYTASLAMTKLSLLFMFKRLFDLRALAITFWTLLIAIVAWAFGSILAVSLVCTPFTALWSNPGQCHSLQALYWGIAVPNILTDIALLAVPMYYIKDVHLSRSQKAGLYVVFSCGGLVIIISIVRLSVLVTTKNGLDITWTAVQECTWSITECNVAIISACLPTLRPLLKELQRQCTNLKASCISERLESTTSTTTDPNCLSGEKTTARNCTNRGLKLVLSFHSAWMQSVEDEMDRRIGQY